MDETQTVGPQRGSWVGTCSLLSVHLIAFGMLYLVLVQMNWAFGDCFIVVGTNPTPRFESASMISDFIAAFTPVVLVLLALHLFVVFVWHAAAIDGHPRIRIWPWSAWEPLDFSGPDGEFMQ